jgi:hypothetical protein
VDKQQLLTGQTLNIIINIKTGAKAPTTKGERIMTDDYIEGLKRERKLISKSHWSVRNNDKEIEYKGYLIEKFTWGRRQYDYFLSKDGVDIKYAQLIPYINLEPSIYNKKQCGLSIKNYKLLIDKYLLKECA